jgi:hypothetical protein
MNGDGGDHLRVFAPAGPTIAPGQIEPIWTMRCTPTAAAAAMLSDTRNPEIF